MKCFVFGAGEFYGMPYAPDEKDYIIAADGGYEYVKQCNLTADYVIGDFDSLGFVPEHDNVEVHPVMKDDTDMFMAVKKGMELGYKEFVIYGGLGGRTDHSISNIQTAAYLAKEGCVCYLIGSDMVITVISGSISFEKGYEGKLSVFAHGDNAYGVNINGLLYEVSDYIMENTKPIGVSNEFTGKEASVSVEKGMLQIMWEINTHMKLPCITNVKVTKEIK
ncbi:MAG: thiamine diphosphokinase [Lachnospiraceae bacterium]|nr:thiamine diphosphokinase [Lachnospiraceae bacterium]